MSLFTLLVISLLSGSLIKLTDDIEDKNLIRKIYAIPAGFAYGLLIGYLMISDTGAALLFGGIVLGNLITGKINSAGHYSGLGAILAVFFLYGTKLPPLVLLITALAALDEMGDLTSYGYRPASPPRIHAPPGTVRRARSAAERPTFSW